MNKTYNNALYLIVTRVVSLNQHQSVISHQQNSCYHRSWQLYQRLNVFTMRQVSKPLANDQLSYKVAADTKSITGSI